MGRPLTRSTRRGRRGLRWDSLEARTLCTTAYGLPSGAADAPPTVHDLGDVTSAVSSVGARATSDIPANGSVAFRLSLARGGDYLLWCRYTGVGVSLEYAGPRGSTEIMPGAPGATEYFDLQLVAGDYTLTAEAYGGSPASVDWELLLANGVAQNAAVATRLIDPTAFEPTVSQNALVPIGLTLHASGPTRQDSPTSVGLSYDRPLLGRPTLDDRHIAVVGPTTPDGSHSLASLSAGLSPGLVNGPVPTIPDVEVAVVSVGGVTFESRDGLRIERDGAALAAVERVLALIPKWLPEFAREPPDSLPDGWPGPSTSPLWVAMPEPGDGESTSSDPSSAWMVPAAAMVVHTYVRLRKQADVRGRTPRPPAPAPVRIPRK
jgi:hypothetical protein